MRDEIEIWDFYFKTLDAYKEYEDCYGMANKVAMLERIATLAWVLDEEFPEFVLGDENEE